MKTLSLIQMQEKLKSMMSKERFEHSIGTMEMAESLAEKYGCNVEQARVAGLLHDCAKEYGVEETIIFLNSIGYRIEESARRAVEIYHQYMGGIIAMDKFGVDDRDIINAISCHTTGRKNMTLLDKVVYLADLTERTRSKDPEPWLDDLRKLCDYNLDMAMLLALEMSIRRLLDDNRAIQLDTIQARNSILLSGVNLDFKLDAREYTTSRWDSSKNHLQ